MPIPRPKISIRTIALAGLVVTAAIAALALAGGGADQARRLVRRLRSWPVLQARAAAATAEAPLSRLAASQVGYGPAMRKQFTSPRPFRSFQVLRTRDGAVAFQGGAPARAVQTDLLGDLGTVWIGDFSGLAEPGRYRLVADGGLTSHPFDVGPGAFDPAARAVQRWFYYQRAFTAVDAAHAEGPWVHPSDADKAPPGVRGGWHDAGDLTVYSAAANSALFWLLQAAHDFGPTADDTNIPESGNGVPDLLDEARWGLEWLLSVQGAAGGFVNTTCQDRYGPYGTNTPNSVPPYRSGEVGTLATARAVGTLAVASTVYRRWDPAFALRCLEAAARGYRYLEARPEEHSDGPSCPNQRADGDLGVGRSARMYAAAGMLLATGGPGFDQDFAASLEDPQYDPAFMHLNGPAVLLYLRAPAGRPALQQALRRRLLELAKVTAAEGERHPFGWAGRYHWGSLSGGFNRTGLYSVQACLTSGDRAGPDCEQALANVHYLLGRNALQHCYVSGLPGVSRGMSGGFSHWLAALHARPRDFPGMVAGGPNASPEPADRTRGLDRPVVEWGYWDDPAFPRDAATPVDARYTDNDSWSTNEVSVEAEATTLYHLLFARWMSAPGARPSPAGR